MNSRTTETGNATVVLFTIIGGMLLLTGTGLDSRMQQSLHLHPFGYENKSYIFNLHNSDVYVYYFHQFDEVFVVNLEEEFESLLWGREICSLHTLSQFFSQEVKDLLFIVRYSCNMVKSQ